MGPPAKPRNAVFVALIVAGEKRHLLKTRTETRRLIQSETSDEINRHALNQAQTGFAATSGNSNRETWNGSVLKRFEKICDIGARGSKKVYKGATRRSSCTDDVGINRFL